MTNCNHILSAGKNKGDQCPKNGIHEFQGQVYCKKHLDMYKKKDNKNTTLENDPIFNDDIQSEPTQPATRKSIFNITINTNKDYNKMSDQEKLKFKKVVEYLFHRDNIIKYLKDMSNPSDPMVNMVDLQTDYAFEIGGKYNRLHAHGYVDTTHMGMMQINQALVRTVINRYLGSNVHLNISAQKSLSRISYEKYMNKSKELP